MKKELLGRWWNVEREIRLNKEGKVIGLILSFNGKKVYYTKRTPGHFYIKGLGFGLQKAILPTLFKMGIMTVCIDYFGKQGRKLYISHIADWVESTEVIDYVKDRDSEQLESYGQQKVLAKAKMKEIKIGM
jgi:hypothetical protein